MLLGVDRVDAEGLLPQLTVAGILPKSERRVSARLPDLDVEVAVLTCEDLILHKLLAGRMIDRADSAALLRLNRAALDVAYLRRTANELVLGSELEAVWSEAFPGDPYHPA